MHICISCYENPGEMCFLNARLPPTDEKLSLYMGVNKGASGWEGNAGKTL